MATFNFNDARFPLSVYLFTAFEQKPQYLPSMTSGPSSVKEQSMLGIGSDAVLAALATVVRKPKPKRKPAATKLVGDSIATPSFEHSIVIEDTVTIGSDGHALPTASEQKLHPLDTTDRSMSKKDTSRPTLKADNYYVLKNPAQVNVAFLGHESETRDWKVMDSMSHLSAKMVATKAAKTTAKKAVVVDFWFNDDARRVKELVKFARNALNRIKIWTDVMNQEDMIRELRVAVNRGVMVQVIIDVKKTIAEGLESIKQLIDAGVHVCHCTEKIQWKVALFDGQVLVQGSPRMTRTESNMEDYTMVHTGPVVSAFETQFDKIWQIATKKVVTGMKRSRMDNFEPDNEDPISSKHQKRTYFPTNVALLEMLGL